MTKRQATEVITSGKIETSEDLLKAINSLGSSAIEIKRNLIKLGFGEADQTQSNSCPVCRYLQSLGIASPYIDVVSCGINGNPEIRITELPRAMKKFQEKAGIGAIPGMGGYLTKNKRIIKYGGYAGVRELR